MAEKQNCRVSKRYDSIEVEQEESLLVVETNAVVNPWAVMVDHHDALLTLVAVVHVRWLNRVADETFAI